jgi:hypothetical protein
MSGCARSQEFFSAAEFLQETFFALKAEILDFNSARRSALETARFVSSMRRSKASRSMGLFRRVRKEFPT